MNYVTSGGLGAAKPPMGHLRCNCDFRIHFDSLMISTAFLWAQASLFGAPGTIRSRTLVALSVS